jgi:hypothetical protein
MAPIGTLSTGNARCAEKPVRHGRDCEGPYLRLDQNGGYRTLCDRRVATVCNGTTDIRPAGADTANVIAS